MTEQVFDNLNTELGDLRLELPARVYAVGKIALAGAFDVNADIRISDGLLCIPVDNGLVCSITHQLFVLWHRARGQTRH